MEIKYIIKSDLTSVDKISIITIDTRCGVKI